MFTIVSVGSKAPITMQVFDLKTIVGGDSEQLVALFVQLAHAMGQPEDKLRSRFIADVIIALGPIAHHQALGEKYSTLKAALECQFLQIEDLATNNSHPLNACLDHWLTKAILWHPADSRASHAYVEKLDGLFVEIAVCKNKPAKAWQAVESALASADNWLKAEERRASMAEARLCESTESECRTLAAECAVLDLFNQQLLNRYIPDSLKQGLETTLKDALKNTVLTAGETEYERLPFWQFWQRQLYQLAQIYGEHGVVLGDQELYQSLPGQLEKLEQSLATQTMNLQAYEVWVDELSTCLLKTVQKQPINCFKFSAIAYPEGVGQTQVTMTPSYFAQFSQLKPQDWFYFRTEESQPWTQALRCKLALKHEQSGQLLFVDRLGRKVLAKSIQDFALCLTTEIAQPLTVTSAAGVWEKVIGVWVKRANLTVKNEQAKIKSQHQQREIRGQEEKQRIELAIAEKTEKAQVQRRQDAALKARVEALAFKQDVERKKVSATAATQSVEELQVGAWLEVSAENTEAMRCKLSVIIQSTGKYILVDQLGRKYLELLKPDLLDRLASGNIVVLHKGNNFEDQLAKVIQGLRRDVS